MANVSAAAAAAARTTKTRNETSFDVSAFLVLFRSILAFFQIWTLLTTGSSPAQARDGIRTDLHSGATQPQTACPDQNIIQNLDSYVTDLAARLSE